MEHPATPFEGSAPVPDGFDYDMWCGPAPVLPYHPERRWLNFSAYSLGPIPGDAIHQLDLARYLMGDPDHPTAVTHSGGIDVLRDGRDTPDTQLATFDYGKFRMLLEATLWTPYMKKTAMGDRERDVFPNWPFSATKLEVLGTRGFMALGRHGGGYQIYNANGEVTVSQHGRPADLEHIANFLSCIRSRAQPQSDVAQGHASTLLCQLANAAWQAGNRSLRFDPATESFPDAPEVNRYLGRSYRAPWALPEKV
jgi:predicted dehydrogenase